MAIGHRNRKTVGILSRAKGPDVRAVSGAPRPAPTLPRPGVRTSHPAPEAPNLHTPSGSRPDHSPRFAEELMEPTPKPPKTDPDAHAPGMSRTLEDNAARSREHRESLRQEKKLLDEEDDPRAGEIETRRRI